MTLVELQGRRVLVTQSNDFMGPALQRVFEALGADVRADPRAFGDEPALAARVVEEAGVVDVLIAHLACARAVDAGRQTSTTTSGGASSLTSSIRCRAWSVPCCRRCRAPAPAGSS